MRKLIATLFLTVCAMMLGGCASIPTVTDQAVVNEAKSFAAPEAGKANVYVYRHGWLARNDKFDLFLDQKQFGQSENKHFFLLKLDAGKTYTLGTESEFSNNELVINAEEGKTYYVLHYVRMGIMFSQSDFELQTEPDDIADAQELIKKSDMGLLQFK